MGPKCNLCGSTDAESLADAKTLGLDEEFRAGVYTCCQIGEWAHEQWTAWFEATTEDAKRGCEETIRADYEAEDAALVLVRFRRPVPWFRRK